MIEQFIRDQQLDAMRIAGRKIGAGRPAERTIPVFNPYTERQIGSGPTATLDEVREAFAIAAAYKPTLTRF